MIELRKWCVILLAISALAAPAAAEERSARQSDLDIAAKYVDTAPSFTAESRAQARQLVSSIRKQADGITDAQFVFAMMKVAAMADNAHDNLHLRERSWLPKLRVPVRFIWFSDALVIARAPGEYSDLLGASVLAVEGLTPEQLMERLRPLQGGIDGFRRWQLNWIFHSPEALHALGIAPSADRLNLRLKLTGGKVVDRVLKGRLRSEGPPGQPPSMYWIAAPLPGESENNWRSAIDPGKAPLYLQEGNAWFRMAEIPEMHALYVQFRSNIDEADAKIDPFVASVSQKLKQAPPQNIIVDLRFDTGGDNTRNRDLMKQIAQTVKGRIYVLVGNYTFSAGIAAAAALKHDGGNKVTIVGSEIGDRTYWWSEHGDPLCLPAAGVCFSINTGYWDIVKGCNGNNKCYGDQFDLNVASLAPAIKAPLTSADWLANRDPGLEAIAADLKAHSTR